MGASKEVVSLQRQKWTLLPFVEHSACDLAVFPTKNPSLTKLEKQEFPRHFLDLVIHEPSMGESKSTALFQDRNGSLHLQHNHQGKVMEIFAFWKRKQWSRGSRISFHTFVPPIPWWLNPKPLKYPGQDSVRMNVLYQFKPNYLRFRYCLIGSSFHSRKLVDRKWRDWADQDRATTRNGPGQIDQNETRFPGSFHCFPEYLCAHFNQGSCEILYTCIGLNQLVVSSEPKLFNIILHLK